MPKHRQPHRSDRVNPLAAKLQRAADTPAPLPVAPLPPPPIRTKLDAVGAVGTSKISLETVAPAPVPAFAPPPATPHVPASNVGAALVGTQGTDNAGAGASPIPAMSGAVTTNPPTAYSPAATYTFRLHLRGSVASKYALAAVYAACDPEEVMERRLSRYADASDTDSPLSFTDLQRREIMESLGTSDPESIVRHIRNLVSAAAVTTNGTPVSTLRFSAQQLERVALRCAVGETLTDKLQEYADYGINLQTGLA